MEIEARVEIDRPPDLVWPVMVDVERWPDWTPSVTAVELIDGFAFGVGSRVRIRQPRLKTLVWQVSNFKEGRLFIWDTRSPGVFIVATHEVTPRAHGSTVILKIKQTGWLSPLVALLFGNLTRRYVHMEAQALKQRCELLPNPASV